VPFVLCAIPLLVGSIKDAPLLGGQPIELRLRWGSAFRLPILTRLSGRCDGIFAARKYDVSSSHHFTDKRMIRLAPLEKFFRRVEGGIHGTAEPLLRGLERAEYLLELEIVRDDHEARIA